MKKTLAILLIVVLASMLIAIPASAAAVTQSGEAAKAETGPTIDGNIDDVWGQATAYPLSIIKVGEDTGIKGTFKVLWNPTTLYVLYEVPDTTPNQDATDNYKRDSTELPIDFPNLKSETYEDDNQIDITFFANGDPLAFGKAGNNTWDDSMVTYAVNASATGYVYEIAVNCGAAGFTLKDDMIIGMDAQINDNAEGAGERNACYAWNDDGDKVWDNPSYMGNMKLLAGAAAPAATPELEATPAAETAAPIADAAAPAADATPAPAPAPAATPSPAPQTADPIILIALGSIISAAGVVIAKKRK